jgi:hypothetical protein
VPSEFEISDYLERSGDDCIANGNTEHSKEGFCIWNTLEDKLILIQVYGNGEYWNEWATNKAKELGKDKIMFATKRNPASFIRKYEYIITGYILERNT